MLKHIFAALLCLFPIFAQAQENPRAILVLDASGSMWGQIDGTAKITIAQDVIGELLSTLPEDQELGLTVYGHRRKGDCSDIETLIQPGTGTRDAIAAAVNAIKPKGKTPLSAAVIQAAEALKYTEEKATVILVSDGRETCELNPCEVGRKLEEAGIDFTAHVIGFDISNPQDKAELQCLAEETGGTFRTASNAAELADALQVVAEPEPVKVLFRAIEGKDGPVIETPLVWWLGHDEKIIINAAPHDNNFTMDLLAGSGRVEVMRPEDEAVAEAEFVVSKDNMTVTIVLPELLTPITLNAPDKAPAASEITITWDDPDNKGLYIDLAKPGAKSTDNFSYFNIEEIQNNTLEMRLPSFHGTYEIRYKSNIHGKILASRTIEVTAIPIKIYAPDSTPAGSVIDIKWEGPRVGHVISLAKPGDKTDSNIRYFYIDHEEGNSRQMALPSAPGIYELRYKTDVLGRILTSRQIELVNRPITLNAPDTAPVGSTITINWEGPVPGRVISLAKPDAKPTDNIKYFYVGHKDGNSAEMKLPVQPGTYELRYQEDVIGRILTKRTIEVTEVGASLTAPDKVEVGETFKVIWDGPNKQISGGGDYIAISKPGSDASTEITYAYTEDSENNTVEIIAPIRPGTYELRYVLNGNGNRVLAKRELVVTPVTATVNFEGPATAGGTLDVSWTGPDRQISGSGDYISLSKPGSKGNDEITYAYTEDSEGNVVTLEVPTTPGTYEIRYILNGSENIILASKEVQVVPVMATLSFTSPAPAGGTLAVTWDGPGGEDYIAIALPGMKVSEEVTYAYVSNSDGDSVEIELPTTPGTYELRYIQKGNEKKILAAEQLVVEPVKATLEFTSPAPAGGSLAVKWSGPGDDDYLAIALPGMKVSDEVTYSYLTSSDGDILKIDIPTTPGTYELRYVQKGNERKILAVQELVVEPVKATLEFASPAPAGGKLLVTWNGPGGDDYIAIALAAMGVNEESTYAYLSNSDGNTIEIDIPAAPGPYELRYLQKGNELKILAAVPLDVVPMTASLQAGDTAPRGDKVQVTWEGPAHRRDTIIIAKPGSDSAEAFASIAGGSPATLYAPMVAGDYDIRYIYGPLNKVLATIPLKVE